MVAKAKKTPAQPKDPELAARLDYVIRTCKYPSDAEFARAIGTKNPQNVAAWRARGSFGEEGDVLIATATGADMLWLKTGRGEPFPNGPIVYSGATVVPSPGQLLELQAGVDGLTAVVAAILQALFRTAPAEAAGVTALIRAYQARPGYVSEAVRTLLVAAEKAALDVAPAGAPAARRTRR